MRLIERHYGISRTVYLVWRWAIKVPRLRPLNTSEARPGLWAWTIPRTMLANQSETQWSDVDGVAPVLRSLLGGLVNIYPRCQPWPHDYEPPYDKIGVGWLPRDRKPQNIGMLARGGLAVPVWLDYDGSWNGCPHERNAAGLTMDDDE